MNVLKIELKKKEEEAERSNNELAILRSDNVSQMIEYFFNSTQEQLSVDVDALKEKEREFQVRITESLIEFERMKESMSVEATRLKVESAEIMAGKDNEISSCELRIKDLQNELKTISEAKVGESW